MIIIGGVLLSLGLTIGSYFWFPFFQASPWFLLLLIPFFLGYFCIFINVFWLFLILITRRYKGKKYTGKVNMFCLYCIRNVSFALLFLKRIRVIKKNLYKIPKKQPCLILFNHISDFDCWVLYWALNGRYAFVGKLALLYVPIIGALSSSIGTLYADAGNTELNRDMVDHAVDYIKRDTHVLIAPEGTRDFDGKIRPFRHGGFHIALRSNCQIICLGIKNMEKVLLKKRPFVVNVEVDAFKVISPSEYEGMTAGELSQYCENAYLDYLGQK